MNRTYRTNLEIITEMLADTVGPHDAIDEVTTVAAIDMAVLLADNGYSPRTVDLDLTGVRGPLGLTITGTNQAGQPVKIAKIAPNGDVQFTLLNEARMPYDSHGATAEVIRSLLTFATNPRRGSMNS